MRKYLEISKTYMKTQLVWRADVAFNMIFTVTKILFACLLWGMVFQNREAVGGLLVLCGWMLFMQFLIGAVWKKYRVKYDGVGI